MLHRIQFALDNNSRRKIFAVIANMIDWNSAFARQCPKLGIQSFQRNGVRNTLLPLLVSYFQERYQSVKWRGFNTSPKLINVGGPQGATLGILEYLSQTSNSAECVDPEDRFKFVDDLTIIEIVNLLTIVISSFNTKNQVPNDIGDHNQYIAPENLSSQDYLNRINTWTLNQKMKINQTETKSMIFNFTTKYQFNTRLKLEEFFLETIDETKLLGTIITNNLKWDRNTEHIVKKAYARMEILRNLSSFQAPETDMKQVYIAYIRSLLEQSSNVWQSSLSVENKTDLERVQKIALTIILKDKYKNYQNALPFLELDTLKDRRQQLCLSFAKKCLKNKKMKHLFEPNLKLHEMETRDPEHFKVLHANTERFKHGPIIYMQNLLNTEVRRRMKDNNLWNI